MATDKQRLLALIQSQPETATWEELIDAIRLERMIERGLADCENGRTISHEEMGRRIAKWSAGNSKRSP